uniref:Uncharacterized protein n=1 Tax=Physcomitrium patens TaxID=3218 RepID=A0A2K1IQM8_PHYPA|nr:hypothetical protein PHYPA_025705 [Physcomitrium patens]
MLEVPDLLAIAIAHVKIFRRMKILIHQFAVNLFMNQSINQRMNGSMIAIWILSIG